MRRGDAEALRPEWESLVERCQQPELTLTPDWLLTWWRVYGGLKGRALKLGVVRDNSGLVGLAPLVLRRHRYAGCLPFRRLELCGSGKPPNDGIYSNHLAVLGEHGREGAVAEAIVAALERGAFGRWDELVLTMMSGATEMPGCLAGALRKRGFQVESAVVATAPYQSLPGTWDEYVAGLSQQSRRGLKRAFRSYEAWAGRPPQLGWADNAAEALGRGKQILLDLHHARWDATPDGGVFRSSLYLQFHEAMMTQLAGRGQLELLWLQGPLEPTAALYGMVWRGKLYAYQLGRRLDLLPHLRPGIVLTALAIQRSIGLGRRECDLLADIAPYKLQLVTHARPLVRVRAARRCLVETLYATGRQVRARLARKPVPVSAPGMDGSPAHGVEE